jgi:alkanesulfonate monooxygenase SsuD/methylene tetrahydromethanopterin reductase-like flavin-dependent oxidoreductase (luciferase family)
MIAAACTRVGRDVTAVARTNGIQVNLPGWQAAPGNAVVREGRAAMGAVEGSPTELADLLRTYAQAGVAQVHIFLDPETPEGIETFGRTLELLDRGG